MLTKFFFDVADVDYIKDKWNKIKDYCNPKSVCGVTTNPGIWNKAGITTFDGMRKRLFELCSVISEIRNDFSGVVYTQPPYSDMPVSEIERFIRAIIKCGDDQTMVGCKLPPYRNVLEMVKEWRERHCINFNVTGLSDCSTALMAASYNVEYISIIPGRMEGAGINAREQVAYIQQAKLGNTEIITGAMRTVECLRWVCQYGTIPTIGTRIWDKIFTEVGAENFAGLWTPLEPLPPMKFSPCVDKAMTDLSIGFFKQMDELGQEMYKGFKEQL